MPGSRYGQVAPSLVRLRLLLLIQIKLPYGAGWLAGWVWLSGSCRVGTWMDTVAGRRAAGLRCVAVYRKLPRAGCSPGRDDVIWRSGADADIKKVKSHRYYDAIECSGCMWECVCVGSKGLWSSVWSGEKSPLNLQDGLQMS